MFCIQQKRSPDCSRVSAASGTRSTGYELQKEGNGVFRVSQGYSANGRIATASFMHEEIERTFRYHYLPGSDLLQILSMPNGIMLTQSYEEKRNLLTGMDYVRENSLVTQRRYTYDALARPETRDTRYPNKRISHNDSFAYNHRRELTGAPLGNSAYTYAYDNIGNRITAEGDVSQSIQWSSEYNDTELDLVYYNYRYYSPTDGRWTRRDPIGESASLSLFAYVNNNPTIFVDERGLKVSISADKNTCTIIVNLNIVIYSSSTHPVKRQELETLKQTIKNSIESRWNGFKKGCCDIEFRVSISVGDGDDIPWWIQRLFSSVNYIEITNEDKYRSRVYGKGGGTGTWWANANEWVYAHETRHLAGLPDNYKDEKRIDPKTGKK